MRTREHHLRPHRAFFKVSISIWAYAILACAMLAYASPRVAIAQTQSRMSFRNNLQPGHLTVHRLTRVVERKAKRKHYDETLITEQQAKWVRCNIDEPKPGRVMFYQMMVDKPARVRSLFRDKRKVKAPPPASEFGLSRGSTRLHSTHKSPYEAPTQIPLVNPAEAAVLGSLLDFAHWPSKRIDVGHRWQRDIEISGFRGTQTFEFIDVTKTDGKAVARLTLFVEGQFTNDLGKDHTFGKGQAILLWSRPDRTLLSMEARAEYQRYRENAPETYELKLDVVLEREAGLSEDAQELVKTQLTLFAKALKHERGGDFRGAVSRCSEYRDKWPRSLWLPAIKELENRVDQRQAAKSKTISSKQVDDALIKTIAARDAATENYEYDIVDRTSEALRQIADSYHDRLVKLARSRDKQKRARAIFSLAFSGRAEDLSRIEKAAKDKSADVREMALAGLAVLRSPEMNMQIVLDRLVDDDARVRRRACEATIACVSPEHFSVVAIVERLDHIITSDKDTSVRLVAVRALGAVGVPADISKLVEARANETDKGVREAMDRAIERLTKRNE